MPAILYGQSAYSRSRGGLPELPLRNMFVEQSPLGENGVVLISRKGLAQDRVIGSGPIRAIYQRDGVLGDALFIVSGSDVYCNGRLIGQVAGDGPVSIAGRETEILIAAGGTLRQASLTAVADVPFPDGAAVSAVTFLAGRYIAVRKDSNQFYYTDVLEADAWQGLSFASAENQPDRILDCLILNDDLVLIGTETIEFWMKTGSADAPFTPFQGRVFQRGAMATGCAVVEDNSFFWIGDDGIVYRNGQVPEAIADDGIVERVKASSSHSLILIEDDRHKFLCVRLDGQTMAFDITTRQWCEFGSAGRSNFRGCCAGAGLIGDDETGALWRFDGYEDAGGPLVRNWRGGIPLTSGGVVIHSVHAAVEVGDTPYLSGENAEPVIELRTSSDYGQNWSEWQASGLGAAGQYRTIPQWRALGLADAPGMLIDWRVTAPVSLRFSAAYFNEPLAGRSR